MTESTRRELANLRAGYSRLLEMHPLDSYAEARQTLMRPLLELWKAAYEKSCPRDVHLELLDYRGCAFLHDSACTVSVDAVCRVVAALTTSQELLPFESLLARAIVERDNGVTPATLELIDNTLSALLDAASRREAEALRRAMACSVQLHHQSVLDLMRRFVDDVQHWSPRPRNLLDPSRLDDSRAEHRGTR